MQKMSAGIFKPVDAAMEAYFLAQFLYTDTKNQFPKTGNLYVDTLQQNAAAEKAVPDLKKLEEKAIEAMKLVDETFVLSTSGPSSAARELKKLANKFASDETISKLPPEERLAAAKAFYEKTASIVAIKELDDGNGGARGQGRATSHTEFLAQARASDAPSTQTASAQKPANDKTVVVDASQVTPVSTNAPATADKKPVELSLKGADANVAAWQEAMNIYVAKHGEKGLKAISTDGAWGKETDELYKSLGKDAKEVLNTLKKDGIVLYPEHFTVAPTSAQATPAAAKDKLQAQAK